MHVNVLFNAVLVFVVVLSHYTPGVALLIHVDETWTLLLHVAGAHKRKEHVTSILHNSDHGVKSSASGCGVTRLNDYHIKVCLLAMTRNP